jgi:hypothetical protein
MRHSDRQYLGQAVRASRRTSLTRSKCLRIRETSTHSLVPCRYDDAYHKFLDTSVLTLLCIDPKAQIMEDLGVAVETAEHEFHQLNARYVNLSCGSRDLRLLHGLLHQVQGNRVANRWQSKLRLGRRRWTSAQLDCAALAGPRTSIGRIGGQEQTTKPAQASVPDSCEQHYQPGAARRAQPRGNPEEDCVAARAE